MASNREGPSRGIAGGGPPARLDVELRNLRARAGKSLKELESEVHVSDSSLSRYFAGRAVPPWPVVEKLSALAGQDAEPLRPLWDEANRGRRAASPTPVADQPDGSDITESGNDQPVSRRRHRRLLLAAAFVATALLFGSAGVLIGRQYGVQVRAPRPTEDSACTTWPWPGNAGQAVQPPVHPQAPDHAPTIELMEGKSTDGHNAAWARITGAQFGDRVWFDISTDRARSWVQCGPFPVTTGIGTSRAHDTGPNMLFRACGDVPTPAPNARGEICTNW
jgi:transcriptional regulator with XRE-family HTH domain